MQICQREREHADSIMRITGPEIKFIFIMCPNNPHIKKIEKYVRIINIERTKKNIELQKEVNNANRLFID